MSPAPCGADAEAAAALGVSVVPARGLPAKTAPETAGEILARTVCELLAEGGGAHD